MAGRRPRGVVSPTLKLLEQLQVGYRRPALTKTLIREYRLGEHVISETLGSSMHVLLTADRKNFLERINEDPFLACRLVELMSRRVRELTAEVIRLKAALQDRGTQ